MSTSSFAEGALKAADALKPGLFQGARCSSPAEHQGSAQRLRKAFSLLARCARDGATDAEIRAASQEPASRGRKFATLDVRDSKAVSTVVDALPRLHHVVNCAGVIRRGQEREPDFFADVVDINLTGSMRVCAAARPNLRNGRHHRQHRLNAFVLRRRRCPGYSSLKGRCRPTHQISRYRLCGRGTRTPLRPAGSRRRLRRRCATTRSETPKLRAEPR